MMPTANDRRDNIRRVVRISSGNFLEMYDFIVYGYYATAIGQAFFPARSEFASLMLSLVTFGAGYLMRPIGALVLGSYIDRRGRRDGLILTLALMAVGTLTIAVTPAYATIGLAAPVIVVIGRLLQGLSAGVELGGASVYLAEIATPGHRGFYCAWQSGSQQMAVIFTALVGLGLTSWLSEAQMGAWGWRVPLLIGCAIIPLIVRLRRSLEETEAFRRGDPPRSPREVLAIVAAHWRLIALGTMLSVFTTTTFYLITAYTPTFGRQALHLRPVDVLVVTLCVGLSNLVWLPIGGSISDRVGRRPLLLIMPLLCLLTAYPAMRFLVSAPTFTRLLAVQLLFSAFFGLYNGAMVPCLTEIMPAKVRTAAFSLAFSLATAIFGGFSPAVATYLIERTGNKAAPALWLSLAAAISLAAAVLVTSPAPSRAASTAEPASPTA
jgi:MFS family permease